MARGPGSTPFYAAESFMHGDAGLSSPILLTGQM